MNTRIAALSIVTAVVVGCGAATATPSTAAGTPAPSSPQTPATSPALPPSATPTPFTGLRVGMLGDSWPEGAHCGGCRPFPDRYADGLRDITGKPIDFENDSGEQATTTAAQLETLRTNAGVRESVAAADVVGIA